MSESTLRRNLARLITVRAVVSTLLLGGAIVTQMRAPGSFPVDPFFFLIACTFGLTIAYLATLRFVDRHRWLVDAQLACDAIIASAFIYVTGGVRSFFSLLYVLPIVAGSTIEFRRGGLLVATLSALAYGGVVFIQYVTAWGLFPDPWLVASSVVLPPRSVAQYTVVFNVFGFLAVGLLSGSLAESLRTAGARLEQASTQIADLRALNQHVIDSLPSGLATTDRLQRIMTFNRAAQAISGLTFESVAGRPLADVLQLPPDVVNELNSGLSGRGARRLEFAYRRPDGSDIEIGFGATHLQTPGGRAGYLVTFQDVTEFKKLERDVRLQQRLAAVGEMAAGIAHEIRNPLASMSGSIQVLRQELPLSAEQEQLMDIVLRESERLNNTIRSFLAYARPQKLTVACFDLRRALTDTVVLLRNSSEVHDCHTIEVNVPTSELRYEADEGQIRQIIWNLATNGLRAMPSGGRLRLTCREDERLDEASATLVITIEDEGIGMAADELDGLFQPFHGTFAKGSGLGLAIVHRLVSDYEGEIRVTSCPGEGTAVSVLLPQRLSVAA